MGGCGCLLLLPGLHVEGCFGAVSYFGLPGHGTNPALNVGSVVSAPGDMPGGQ